MPSYKELGYNEFGTVPMKLGGRKSETQTAVEQQDKSISLNQLTVGRLTGGKIETHPQANTGVKIVGKTGIDLYGVATRFLDTSGNVGGMVSGITSGGIQLYSTTGKVLIDSGANELRFKYDSMRWDVDPTAEAILAADYYITVSMNGTDYKLMLKAI